MGKSGREYIHILKNEKDAFTLKPDQVGCWDIPT